jgi:glutaconate CoA-transferase, subunit B
MPDHTVDELMCTQMAREIRDGDWVNHGAVVPLAGAALMLAKRTHAPNVDFFYLGTVFNSINPAEANLSEMLIDPKLAYTTSRALISHADILNWTVRGGCDLQFLRPLQIDAYGSVNVSVVGDPKRPKYRFHGIAVADVMITCARPILYTTDHDTRTFPETLPFRTGLGHVDADAWRARIGAPGGGPYRVFTPLGVLDFETPDRRARLRAVNPGITAAQVQENTGFELVIPEDVHTTEPPTEEELRVLREVVDPLGVRQTEFRSMRTEANRRIQAAQRERDGG